MAVKTQNVSDLSPEETLSLMSAALRMPAPLGGMVKAGAKAASTALAAQKRAEEERKKTPEEADTPSGSASDRISRVGDKLVADMEAENSAVGGDDTSTSTAPASQSDKARRYRERTDEVKARQELRAAEAAEREALRADAEGRRRLELESRLTKLHKDFDPDSSIAQLETMIADANRERHQKGRLAADGSGPPRPNRPISSMSKQGPVTQNGVTHTVEQLQTMHAARKAGMSPSEYRATMGQF